MRRILLLNLLSLYFFNAPAQSPLAVAHAHNDYVHSRPFFEAYELQFGSIESDLWLVDGKLLVGHDRKDLRPERTFESLYLNPLLKQIQANGGSPYPNGQPLQLLIDLKSDWTHTLPLLESVLKPHRSALVPAVRIVISGNMPPPDQYARFDPLLTFDGRRKTRYSAEAGRRVQLVSEPFYALAGAWDGKKELAEPVRQRVKSFADSLHAAGKKLRFWATPDLPLAYETLLKLGVDYVGTDDLNGLAAFLRSRSVKHGSGQVNPSQERWLISTPAGDRYTEVRPNGETIIPNGRIVKPLGRTMRIAPHPYGLTLSANGKTAITANSGTNPFSISIIQNVLSEKPSIHQIPDQPKTDDDLLGAVFMGLAVSPDDKLVYVAGGTTNKLFIFDLATRKKVGEIRGDKSFDGTDFSDGYLGDLVLTRDGGTLYCVDQIGFRLLVVDTKKREVIANIPTGRYPFGVTLSPDEKTVYIANVGMFQYQFARHIDRKRIKQTAMKFPPFAFGSKEARDGIKNDSVDIPGLGDPNVPESFSVWAIDAGTRQVTAKVKTGVLVGEKVEGIPAVGGSSPNSLVATDRYVFVSNGNNDNVSVIDPKQGKVVQTIDLRLDERLGRWKGAIPFGLALSPDQKRLYVAESGLNAVGVIDVPTMQVIGHLPVGWFPSKLKVSPDGKKLIVANAKGFGSGPNGGPKFKVGPEGSYIGSLMKGSVTVLDIPLDAALGTHTAQVIRNNFNFQPVGTATSNPVPRYPGEKESPIKYLVFLSKENRTFDEVFGQLKNARGEPSLARFGYNISFTNNKKTASVANATIMPNHLALAKRFGTADNFYVDSDLSADGHRWLSNVYPNEWMETHVSAAYGGKRSFNPDSRAPGKFAFNGSSGTFYPEDYNQDGSMWEHLDRNGISFYNFGFTTEQEGSVSDSTMKVAGEVYTVNYPLPAPMFAHTSRTFPTYNMAIPDQYRVDVFLKEFSEKFMGEGKTMPRFLPLMLPNDHGAGERPAAGFPFRESYMADNDLAVGRVVEFLSHTPYWKNMAIIVTEDDAQGGIDHVDAHRSILQVYSPYAKKNYVSHRHFSFGSLFKTFWNILGIPYLNHYDAGATDLSDFFTDAADFTPYAAVPVDPRVFDPQKALTPLDEKFDWKALKESPVLDDEDYLRKDRAEEDEKTLKEKELQANPRLYPKKKPKAKP